MSKSKIRKLSTMRAALYKGPNQLRVQNVVIPTLRLNQILLKVHAASVCGTDLRIYRGETDVSFNRILGHDFSGIVKAIGSKIRGIKVNNKVAVSPVGHCGNCHYCLIGMDTLCEKGLWHGFEKDGGFAEYVVVDKGNVFKLPQNANLDQYALLEPYVVAMRCFERVRANRGDWICVFGQGAIGLAITSLANFMNLKVIAIDPDKKRLIRSKELGSKLCFPKISELVLLKIKQCTKGMGVDIAIDASGSQIAVDYTRNIVKHNGYVIFTGSGINLRGPLINRDGKELAYIEVELGSLKTFKKVIRLISRKTINPLELIPLHIRLEDLPRIIKEHSKHKLPVVRILVHPNMTDPSNIHHDHIESR